MEEDEAETAEDEVMEKIRTGRLTKAYEDGHAAIRWGKHLHTRVVKSKKRPAGENGEEVNPRTGEPLSHKCL